MTDESGTARTPTPARPNLMTRLLRRLRQAGIVVEPFLVVREGPPSPDAQAAGSGSGWPEPPALPAGMRCDFLTEDDVPQLQRLERTIDAATFREHQAQDQWCYGVWQDDVLVAKMWCDLAHFNHPPSYRVLAADEAYLYAAFADPARRGMNLAPLMRAHGYAALAARGRRRFWSFTDYYNQPARRFKEKLGAVDESLRVHVSLFGKISHTLTLRRYRDAANS